MYIEGIEEIDKKILRLLSENARMSYSEIAEKIGGISRVSVKNRIKALEEKGVIEGYKTIINPTGDPNGIKFFIDIEADPEMLYVIVEALAVFKFNRQIYTVSGESHIHVVGFAPNNEAYSKYVDQVYLKLKGVRKITCHQVLVTHKDIDGGVEYERQRIQ